MDLLKMAKNAETKVLIEAVDNKNPPLRNIHKARTFGLKAIKTARKVADNFDKSNDTKIVLEQEKTRQKTALTEQQRAEMFEFMNSLFGSFTDEAFVALKNQLIPEYLPVTYIAADKITKEILAREISQYFRVATVQTDSLYTLVQVYINNLDTIVSRKLPREKIDKNGKSFTPKCRASKFYDKANGFLQSEELFGEHLIDYSRIMFCLYTAIIDNGYKTIENLNFSADCIDAMKIIESMITEPAPKNKNNKNIVHPFRFNACEKHSSDACTFILAIIFIHKIISDNTLGE